MQNTLNRSLVSYGGPLKLLAGLALGLLAQYQLQAGAFRLPNQDPEAIARGDAFAATADNPSAIYYNPAGITQMTGQNVRAGVYVISPGETYTSPTGVSTKANSSLEAVPQAYYVGSFDKLPMLSFGLGMYAPYGLALDWGNNTQFNTVAEKGSLLYLCFNPVVAWKIFDSLSIGVGPTINYSEANFERALDPSGATQFKFNGNGTDVGFNAGILYQPHPMWSFGVNYRYTTDIDYEGISSQTFGPPFAPATSTSASIKFPQFVVGGVSFRPTTDWNIEFDLDWANWGSLKDINLMNTPFGNVPLTLNYRNSFMYEFGVTRQLGKGYFGSVGYIYNENSSPDANFNPLIPDSNLQLGSIGFGHHGKTWDWAIAYHFGYNGGRTVQSSANPLVDGTYKTFNNAFNLAATFKF